MPGTARPTVARATSTMLPRALALALAAAWAGAVPAARADARERTGAAAPRAAAPARADVVSVDFSEADVAAVTRAMAAMLGRPIVVDPRVKGKLTLGGDGPSTPAQAWARYLAALRGLGFAVVDSAGLLKVVPEADAKLQAGRVQVGAGAVPAAARGGEVLTQVFRLEHELAANLVPVLRPLISANNTINANAGNNTLVITDYADNLQRLARLVAALDVPAAGTVQVLRLKHTVASDLLATVQRLSDTSTSTAAGAAGAAAAPVAALSIAADARLNALVVRGGSPARVQAVRELVAQLDEAPAQGPAGAIHVVSLRNADAARLATVLRAAFSAGAAASGGGSSSSSAGTAAAGLTTSGATASGLGTGSTTSTSSASATGSNSTAATTPVAASQQPSTGGFIQADPATNSLVVTAPEPLFRQVREVIDRLDARRSQIYVEALIVEIDADKAAELGVQWQGAVNSTGDTALVAGTSFGSGLANILGLSVTAAQGSSALASSDLSSLNGLNMGVVQKIAGTYTLGALARALQTRTGANVLSTPNLVTLDNEEARIVVGQNVPFITGSYTTSTSSSTTSPFQTVERKDVGLTLRVRPQVGDGDTVRMTIFQESSAVLSTTAAGTTNAGPSTSKRSIESTVVVDDGALLVLGGLIEDSSSESRSQVPFLGSLPGIGALFRTDTQSRKKTNLMVFLRPVVMKTQAQATALSRARYEGMRAAQDEAQPGALPLVPAGAGPQLPPVTTP